MEWEIAKRHYVKRNLPEHLEDRGIEDGSLPQMRTSKDEPEPENENPFLSPLRTPPSARGNTNSRGTTMTETLTPLPVHVDSTMISCFRSCPQKYYREFVQGYRPPGISIDLHAGACFALAIEVTYRGIWEQNLSLADALERAHGAFAVAWDDFEIPEFKKTAKTFERMWETVEDYFATYPPRTDHVQPYFAADGKATFEYTFAIPLEPACHPVYMSVGENGVSAVETKFVDDGVSFPLHPSGEPFLYTGRFDMLGKYNDRPVVRDEKTTGKSIGSAWADQWDLRSQFIGYTWACQQGGIDLDTVVVRGIAIQKTQIVHAEAIKTYTDFMRARWYEQLRRDMWRIRNAWDEAYFDFNLGDACTAYGSCTFQRVCQSQTPESWLNEFVVRHWNPLDKNPAKEKSDATV